MDEVIYLTSRYNDTHRLERIGESDSHLFSLKTEFSYRVGFNEDSTEYIFVDPAGGPFLTVGSKVDNYTIKSIRKGKNGIEIELE